MGDVVRFPKALLGSRVALFTENRMYVGVLGEQFDLVSDLSIRLENVAVSPIESRPSPESTIFLPEVLVLWGKVVAVAPADGFQINISGPQSAPQGSL